MQLKGRFWRIAGIVTLSLTPWLSACGANSAGQSTEDSRATASMNRVQNFLEEDENPDSGLDGLWEEICNENEDGSETCSFDDGHGTSCSVTFNLEGTILEDSCVGPWGSYNCELTENLLNCDIAFEGQEPCTESWDVESFEIIESSCDFFGLPGEEDFGGESSDDDWSDWGDWDDEDEGDDEDGDDHGWGDWGDDDEGDDEDGDDHDWGDWGNWGDDDEDDGDDEESDDHDWGDWSNWGDDDEDDGDDEESDDHDWGDWSDWGDDDEDDGDDAHGHDHEDCDEEESASGGDHDWGDHNSGDWGHGDDGDDEEGDDHDWGDWDDWGNGDDAETDHEPSAPEHACDENADGDLECTFDDGEWACVSVFADGNHPTYEACESADGSESFTCTREAGSHEISCAYTHGGETCEEVFTPWEVIDSTCDEGFWGEPNPEDIPLP